MPKDKLLIYGVYTKKIASIMYYNTIQSFYRILTSTLLLFSFAAIGVSLSSSHIEMPFNSLVMVVLIGVISCIGTMIFWRLDLIVVERIIISHFYDAYKIEEKNKWLPRVHHRMAPNKKHYACPSKKVPFYIGCGSCLILEAGIASYFFARNYIGNYAYFILFVIIIIIGLYSWVLIKKSGTFNFFFEELNENNR